MVEIKLVFIDTAHMHNPKWLAWIEEPNYHLCVGTEASRSPPYYLYQT